MARSQMRLRNRRGVDSGGVTAARAGEPTDATVAQQYRRAFEGGFPLPTLPGSDAPPVNTVAPAITGTVRQGFTLTCSAGTWTGTPTPAAAQFQWLRNGRLIGGADAATYVPVLADVGTQLRCVVMRSNIYRDTYAESNLTVAVLPA